MARQREHPPAAGAHAATPAESVVVHGEGVRVDRVAVELPRAEARARFGGVDLMSVLAGSAAAIGSLVVLSTLAGSVGRIGYAQGTGEQALSVAGLVAGLVVLGLSLLLGGWVAGRVARYEGGRNGLLTGIVVVVLSAVLATAASQSDTVRDLGLPTWLDRDTFTVAALASLVTGLIVALGSALYGGRLGAGYHRKVDDALLSTRPGGLAPYPTEDGR